jgi:voltage-gated potassium channel
MATPDSIAPWRQRLHTVIFEADTPAGKGFDVALLWAIVLSVAVVFAESVASIRESYGTPLRVVEFVFTGLFTVEYVLRLLAVRRPLKYVFSFYGLVDLLSILPTFVELLLPGAASLRVVRMLRLLRVFRVLKLVGFLREAQILKDALLASRRKITVFLSAVFVLVTLLGTLVYMVEDAEAGFTSIPRSMYWAIVTVTTVGYGDIAPQTVPGQVIASLMMILGYAILAVPTGIVGAELARSTRVATNTQACPSCGAEGHDDDADFCKRCGSAL